MVVPVRFSVSVLAFTILMLTALLLFYKTSIAGRGLTSNIKERNAEELVPSKKRIKKSHFDLRIIVITYDRASSLLRLLNSINDAEYYSDSIKLEVWVDISKKGKKDNVTIDAANKFQFKHGSYDVHVRQKHAGIYGQWLTSWKPSKDSSEIGVILEDDLTVSPLFYKYLKIVHKKYDTYPDINGYALQGDSIKHHVKDTSTLQGPPGSLVFLYPVLGTWGFSPVTTKWIKFLEWFNSIDNLKTVDPNIPNNIASVWYKGFVKHGRADTMWEIWHIYYAWLNKHYTLYSNFAGHASLSNSYREAGLHYPTTVGASNKLLTEWKPEYENLPDMPLYIDIAGKLIEKNSNNNSKFTAQ